MYGERISYLLDVFNRISYKNYIAREKSKLSFQIL